MFYIVNRLFYKGEAETHSTQVFTSYEEARKRFYNIVAADLNDDAITYQFASIMTSQGGLLECQAFDRNTNDNQNA